MDTEICWSNELLTGNSIVDTQHRTFFSLAETLVNSPFNTDVRAIITELYHYAAHHFEDEEKLMHAVDYPDTEQHQEAHRTFLKEVKNLDTLCEAGKMSSTVRLRKMILTWWSEHILQKDLPFFVYYRSHTEESN